MSYSSYLARADERQSGKVREQSGKTASAPPENRILQDISGGFSLYKQGSLRLQINQVRSPRHKWRGLRLTLIQYNMTRTGES